MYTPNLITKTGIAVILFNTTSLAPTECRTYTICILARIHTHVLKLLFAVCYGGGGGGTITTRLLHTRGNFGPRRRRRRLADRIYIEIITVCVYRDWGGGRGGVLYTLSMLPQITLDREYYYYRCT